MDEQNKKFLVVGLLAAAAVIVLAVIIVLGMNMGTMATYHDRANHFTIRYPKGWEVKPGLEGAAVAFISPADGPLDYFHESVNVSVSDLSRKPMTLKDFSDLAIRQIKVVFKTNIKVLEEKSSDLAGIPGYRFMYESTGPEDIITMHVWTIRRDTSFTITYMGLGKEFYNKQKIVDAMIRSFQIVF